MNTINKANAVNSNAGSVANTADGGRAQSNQLVNANRSCVANLLFVAKNGLSRNGLIEPIEPHLFRENSSV